MDTIRWIWFLNTTYLFIKHDLMVMVIFHWNLKDSGTGSQPEGPSQALGFGQGACDGTVMALIIQDQHIYKYIILYNLRGS
jgi:hypothetical protein